MILIALSFYKCVISWRRYVVVIPRSIFHTKPNQLVHYKHFPPRLSLPRIRGGQDLKHQSANDTYKRVRRNTRNRNTTGAACSQSSTNLQIILGVLANMSVANHRGMKLRISHGHNHQGALLYINKRRSHYQNQLLQIHPQYDEFYVTSAIIRVAGGCTYKTSH